MRIIDVNKEGKKIDHTWSTCVGAGRAGEGLRSQWREQLQEAVKECGFRYIRFHGLLAEDMFPVNIKKGKIQYNWYYIDEVYDYLLKVGIRPIVELGFMPPDLASGSDTCFWWKGNISPPKDYDLWKDMILELTRHFVQRYGIEEVLKWYFEVWNEPNLAGFWSGSKSDYFHLYKVSVEAIKSVHKDLKVGGPATSNFVPDGRFESEREDVSKHKTHLLEDIDSLEWRGVWIEDFLNYCHEHHLPVDFISTHPYPTDFALDGQKHTKGKSRKLDSLHEDISWLLKVISESDYKDAEIHLSEWSSSPSSRDYSHDCLAEAAYIIKSNLRCSGMVDSLSYWVFTDVFEEGGGGPEPFHGGFGLINMHGIKKPSYYAYKMLNALGNQELEREENYIVTKNQEGQVKVLFYHYPKEMLKTIPIVYYGDVSPIDQVLSMGKTTRIEFHLVNLQAHAAFNLQLLGGHNNAFALWRDMGMPNNLSKQEEKELKALDLDKKTYYADDLGNLNFSLDLKPWEVALLEQV
jgi:xylan 1,4-beta-xylosidase